LISVFPGAAIVSAGWSSAKKTLGFSASPRSDVGGTATAKIRFLRFVKIFTSRLV
jgi:hypothetical protein